MVYLACKRFPQPRDILANLLWDNTPQDRAIANLRVVLTNLRKVIEDHLLVSRDNVELNPDQEISLDVQKFEEIRDVLSANQVSLNEEQIQQISAALDLSRGGFLDGFSLRGAAEFEISITIERQRLLQIALDGLLSLLEHSYTNEEYSDGISQARNYLRHDPFNEAVYRKLISMLARTGQRTAALKEYEVCQQVLWDEFELEPEDETKRLHMMLIKGKSLDEFEARKRSSRRTIEQDEIKMLRRPLAPAKLVGRRNQLKYLHKGVLELRAGHGKVFLISGEAGSGKSALMGGFARSVLSRRTEILALAGVCDPISGSSTPYLPFSQMMRSFLQDISSLARSYARSLLDMDRYIQSFLPIIGSAFAKHGPNLFNLIIDGNELLDRTIDFYGSSDPSIKRLSQVVSSHEGFADENRQHQIIDQLVTVLVSIAQEVPLILLLDDIHWADSSSLTTLFHLGKRIRDYPILLIGSYRPSEIIRQTSEERHSLEKLIAELSASHGQIVLDLEEVNREEGLAIVDSLIDLDQNDLGVSFRKDLFKQTSGNPLFTLELLRSMQEKGELAQNSHGEWIESETLNWDVLPARVEAVITERINNLPNRLRKILNVASVEGEVFHAQTISETLGIDERLVLSILSRELDDVYKLVSHERDEQVNNRFISKYRFNHVLFRQSLYRHYGLSERRLTHLELGKSLEHIYAEHTEDVVHQLARHYREAGLTGMAINYTLAAADQARLAFATHEALSHYRTAISMLEEQSDYEGVAKTLMKVGLTYHNVRDFRNAQNAFDEAFNFRLQDDTSDQYIVNPAPHPLRYALYEPLTFDPWKVLDGSSATIVTYIFSPLVEHGTQGLILPGVANSWEVSECGRIYTFHLRDDVYWSDSTQVTAHDFVYSILRVLNYYIETSRPRCSGIMSIKGAEPFCEGEANNPEQVGIKAINDSTLEIELERPEFHTFGRFSIFPLPKHVIETHGEQWSDVANIASNGPFLIKSYKPGHNIELARNPSYHGVFRGNVTEIVLKFLQKDNRSRIEEYAANNIDFVILDDEPYSARHDYVDEFITEPAPLVDFITFNTSLPPFDNPSVWRALVMAVDRVEITDKIHEGLRSPASGGIIPPCVIGHSKGIGIPYDPGHARRLLAGAGYPDGDGFPPLNLHYATNRKTLEHVVSQWRTNLNIKIELEFIDSTTLINERFDYRIYHSALGLSEGYPWYWIKWISTRVSPQWKNQKFEKSLEIAEEALIEETHLSYYQDADKILIEEAGIMPLSYFRFNYLVKPWVKLPNQPIYDIKDHDIIIEPH